MTMRTNQSIDNFLAAIAQVHGAHYKDKMSVSWCGGHYYRVKYPDEAEGHVVPVGHLNLMTKDLLAHPDEHALHH